MWFLAASAFANNCPPVLDVDVIVEVTSREANPPHEREEPEPVLHQLTTVHDLDLDGDGIMDAAVPTVGPRSCPHEVTWALFLTRGKCPQPVGTVTGFPEVVAPGELRTVRRWADLTDPKKPPSANNVATLHEVTTTWGLQEGSFVQTSTTETGGVCHHCGMPTCRIRPSER